MTPTVTPHSAARAYAGAIFAVVVWGASFIATKIAVREVSPFTVVWLRFGIGVAVLAAAVAWRGEFARPSIRDLLYFIGLGALGITLHQGLQVTGLRTAQASTTAWIISATPLTMALVGRVVLGERLHKRQAAGIVLGAAGVLTVVTRGDWHALAGGSHVAIGDVLVLITTVTWALFSVFSRRGLQRHRSAPMMLYVMGSGWLLSTIPWVMEGGPAQVARLTPDAWAGIVFLGLLCSGLAYVFWYDALRALPAATVGTILYLQPIVTLVAAAAVLGERITLSTLAGGAIILLGVRVATRRTAA